MEVIDLLEYLKNKDVKLAVSDGKLKYNAPEGAVTDEIKETLKNHKAEIISILKKGQPGCSFANQIILGDCLEELKKIPSGSIDLLVTDPPYGMKFMGKAWDKALPQVEIWKQCLRVLKPGAFAFVMCIPRQDLLCRMILSLEEAGFDSRFTPLYWTFAKGMPKGLNVSKAIDKKAGISRNIIRRNPNSRENCDKSNTIYESGTVGKTAYITEPVTEDAKRFEGAYAGFQPKPAVEIILVVMKPCEEKTYVGQALNNGKGITWIDDCRIPYAVEPMPGAGDRTCNFGETETVPGGKYGLGWHANTEGRFPANLLIDDDVLEAESKGAVAPVRSGQKEWGGEIYGRFKTAGDDGKSFYSDRETSSSYSRYFSLDAWAKRNLPFLIVPKTSKREKNAGLQDFGDFHGGSYCFRQDGSLDGTIPIHKNHHPTVKPLKLMSYLVTLGSREGDIVLDPFSGAGTTCIAAMMLNRDFIGMEIDPEYHQIALQRLEHYRQQMKVA
jgi:DNA modification methylase